MKNHMHSNPTGSREARGKESNSKWRSKLSAVLVMAVFVSSGPAAWGAARSDLFTKDILSSDAGVTAAEATVMEQATIKEREDPTIRRSRYVKANFAVLLKQDSMRLPLFNDVYLTLKKLRVDRRAVDRYTIHGRVEGVERSSVTIVVEKGVMVGNIRADGHFYQIRALGQGLQAIREIDESVFSKEHTPLPETLEQDPAGQRALEKQEAAARADTGDVIDVLVVYTRAAASEAGGGDGIKAVIQLAIDETNEAYANSQITQRLRLVHQAQVQYSETGKMSYDLHTLKERDWFGEDPFNNLDEVHALRDKYGADLVSLWVKQSTKITQYYETCGTAYQMTKPSSSFANRAFSVVRLDCATGNFAFARELAHNMGAQHDRNNASGQGAFPYSYGYETPGSRKYCTIMVDEATCPKPDSTYISSIYIPYFSNPEVEFLGRALGIDESQAMAADNAKTLNNTASIVANFRQTKVFAQRILSPTPGSTLRQTTVTFSGEQTGSGDFRHHLQVGTYKGRTNVYSRYLGTNSSVTVDKLPTTGTIYVRYWTQLDSGHWDYQDHTYTMEVPTPSKLISPLPGSNVLSTTVTFTGEDTGSANLRHWLQVGTAKGGSNIKSQYMGTTSSITVTGLPATGTIYVRYWTALPQGWKYQDHTYTMQVPNLTPKLLSPAPGGILFATTLTFTGEHRSGDRHHWLWLGTAKGKANLKSQYMGTNPSVRVSGLPTSGTIYARYWTYSSAGVWEYQDHTYTMRGYSWNGGTGVVQ